MRYVDLNLITIEHVLGKWEVKDRVVNRQSEGSLFSDIKTIELKTDSYTSVNGKQLTGKWLISRESSIIYNPQLKFFIGEAEVGKAIITRLFYQIDDGSNAYNLTLYFNTGLELILYRKLA